MVVEKIHIDTIERLLASITLTMGEDGLQHSFLFGPPGASSSEKYLGIDIYYHSFELNLTALHVRSVGPRYLKALPLDEIRSKLQNFMYENFGYIGNLALGSRDERPLNLWIPEKEKHELASALGSSAIFQPKKKLTVFPLVPVVVTTNFWSDQFFFSSPGEKNAFFLCDQWLKRQLYTESFPPLVDFTGQRHWPSAWLGVYSPDCRAALKTKSSILGALALMSLPQYRYMFSRRKVFGGGCTISKD